MRRRPVVAVITTLTLLANLTMLGSANGVEPRSAAHQAYAKSLWSYITETVDYTKWQQPADGASFDFTPPCNTESATYLNALARQEGMPHGSIVVTEHLGDAGQKTSLTVAVRSPDGYDSRTGDWYWAHYLADGTPVKTSVDKSPYNKRGFVTCEEDGRLWVFTTDSSKLGEFLKGGELAKHVIRPGAGPAGMTLKSPDAETIDAYVTAKSGFVTKIVDGRLWVFREGAKELEAFAEGGELAKHVIRPGAGPLGMTIKSPDAETIDAYLN